MTNARPRFAVLLFFSLLAVPTNSHAANLDGIVMTVLITTASTVDTTVERIITESALVFLEREGIEVVMADYELSGDEPTRRDITRIARNGKSDFVLFGTYNQARDSATTLNISFSLYMAGPAIPVATFRGETEIDLSLDRSIAGFLEILIDEAFA